MVEVALATSPSGFLGGLRVYIYNCIYHYPVVISITRVVSQLAHSNRNLQQGGSYDSDIYVLIGSTDPNNLSTDSFDEFVLYNCLYWGQQ